MKKEWVCFEVKHTHSCFLFFRETVLKSNNAVKGVGVLGILAEITGTDELELLTKPTSGNGVGGELSCSDAKRKMEQF